jgi:hypothetical protein
MQSHLRHFSTTCYAADIALIVGKRSYIIRVSAFKRIRLLEKAGVRMENYNRAEHNEKGNCRAL